MKEVMVKSFNMEQVTLMEQVTVNNLLWSGLW